jgi:hypothetical protein
LHAELQNPAQGPEGRLAFVRAKLLPPIPACGAARRAGGYVNIARWLSLRRSVVILASVAVSIRPSFRLRKLRTV